MGITYCNSKEGNRAASYRMCIDYRKVNQVSKGDAYPVPNLKFTLNKLQNGRFVSTIDLSKAFHQYISVENE